MNSVIISNHGVMLAKTGERLVIRHSGRLRTIRESLLPLHSGLDGGLFAL
jgi:hypothetical protein